MARKKDEISEEQYRKFRYILFTILGAVLFMVVGIIILAGRDEKIRESLNSTGVDEEDERYANVVDLTTTDEEELRKNLTELYGNPQASLGKTVVAHGFLERVEEDGNTYCYCILPYQCASEILNNGGIEFVPAQSYIPICERSENYIEIWIEGTFYAYIENGNQDEVYLALKDTIVIPVTSEQPTEE